MTSTDYDEAVEVAARAIHEHAVARFEETVRAMGWPDRDNSWASCDTTSRRHYESQALAVLSALLADRDCDACSCPHSFPPCSKCHGSGEGPLSPFGMVQAGWRLDVLGRLKFFHPDRFDREDVNLQRVYSFPVAGEGK